MVRLTRVQGTAPPSMARAVDGSTLSTRRFFRHAGREATVVRRMLLPSAGRRRRRSPTLTQRGGARMDMDREPDENLDRPEERGSADVTLVTRGVTVTASVEVSSTGVVI